MSDQDAPEPFASALEMGSEDEEADAYRIQEQASTAPTKHCKMEGLTKYEDKYAVSKLRGTLSAKANKCEFAGLRADACEAERGEKQQELQQGFRVSCFFRDAGGFQCESTRQSHIKMVSLMNIRLQVFLRSRWQRWT